MLERSLLCALQAFKYPQKLNIWCDPWSNMAPWIWDRRTCKQSHWCGTVMYLLFIQRGWREDGWWLRSCCAFWTGPTPRRRRRRRQQQRRQQRRQQRQRQQGRRRRRQQQRRRQRCCCITGEDTHTVQTHELHAMKFLCMKYVMSAQVTDTAAVEQPQTVSVTLQQSSSGEWLRSSFSVCLLFILLNKICLNSQIQPQDTLGHQQAGIGQWSMCAFL